MNIESRVEKIKFEKPILEKIEKFFKENGYEPIRWAIVDIKDGFITLDFSILNRGENIRLVNKFLHNIF